MKTAISLPDHVFDAAEAVAHRLGISRSQLYARAVEAFLREHRDDQVTEILNQVYGDQSSELDPVIVAIQSAALPDESW